MLLRKSIKEGLVVLLIYSIITFVLFMAAERVERLEKLDNGVSVQINYENNK